MKKTILCLVLFCMAVAMLTPAMGEEMQIITETVAVAHGNGTVYTDYQTSQVNMHEKFVALSPKGMVYTSQVNGQNVSMNASEVISQELEDGMQDMQTIKPIRDPFKIQIPEAFNKK